MSASDVFPWWKFCQNNGGNCAFVWYAAGMPWAVSTMEFDASSLTTDHRRRMFGYQDDDNTDFPADTLPIRTLLEPPGSQSIRVEDIKGLPSGGDWSVNITDSETSISWTHTHNGRTVAGLDGLTTIPDPRLDPTISVGSLAATLNKADGRIYIKNDYGERLQATIEAETGNRCDIWVGNECMRTWDTITDTGVGEFNVKVTRGIYKTRPQTHAVGLLHSKPISVADAPLGGITNRPCYLYAIPLDENGQVLNEAGTFGAAIEIAMVRHGRVGSRIERKRDRFSVSCSPWWTWLNQKRKAASAKASLRGYYFTHGNSDDPNNVTLDVNGGNAHCVIWENTGGTAFAARQIWLCTEDNSVFYETKEEVVQALQQEIMDAHELVAGTTANGSEMLTYPYTVNSAGVHHDATDKPTYSGWVTGVVPWACNLGPPNSVHTADILNAIRAGDVGFTKAEEGAGWIWKRRIFSGSGDISVDPWYDEYNTALYTPLSAAVGDDGQWAFKYCYQFDWHGGTGTADYYGDEKTEFPMSGGKASGVDSTRLYLSDENDADNFVGTQDLFVGASDRFLGETNTLSTCEVNAVNSANNYLTIVDENSVDYWNPDQELPSMARLRHVAAAQGQPTDGPMKVGMCLFYMPASHNVITGGDPWPVHQNDELKSDQLSDIFKAILGDDAGNIDLPEAFETNSIPDAVTLSVNGETEFYESIDWDSFDAVCQRPLPDMYYALSLDDQEINFYTLLRETLKLHAACATWEYSAADFQYVMRFRPIGIVNATAANIEGRTLGADERQIYERATGEHSSDWMLTAVAAQFQYDQAQNKYLIKLNASDEYGLSVSAGQDVTLSITDKLTHIANYNPNDDETNNALAKYFIDNHLLRLAWPMPSQTIPTTIKSTIEAPLGTSVLVSDPAAPNPYDGTVGLVSQPALVTGISTDLSRGGATKHTYRLSPNSSFDWAPSCRITTIAANGANGATISGFDAHRWSDSAGRNDLAFFGAFTFSLSTGILTRVTEETFLVNLHEEGEGGTVYEDVSCVVNSGATGAELTLGGLGSIDTNVNWIMTFANWDSALHASQRNWIFNAEVDGTLDDGVTVRQGREWE